MESVPFPPKVFTKPLEVKLERAGMEAEEFTVKVEKLAAVEKRFVELAVVEKKLVVVALVPVAVLKVKFWSVVEPEESTSPAWFTENLVVEATFKSRRLPVNPVRASAPITVPVVLKCSTESLA